MENTGWLNESEARTLVQSLTLPDDGSQIRIAYFRAMHNGVERFWFRAGEVKVIGRSLPRVDDKDILSAGFVVLYRMGLHTSVRDGWPEPNFQDAVQINKILLT